MFTPLSKSAKDALKKDGNINLLISPGWDGRETSMSAPYSILYSRNDASIHSSIYLYYCSVMLGRTMYVDNIVTTRNILAKPMAYLFLEMTVDAIEKLAYENMSHKLIIRAKVSGFEEIAFNKGFKIDQTAVKGLSKAVKEL